MLLCFLALVAFWPCLLPAFTVTVPKDLYVVEYGGNVTLECRFPVDKQLNLLALVVYWEMEDKKIIQFVNGEEDVNVQHDSYKNRVTLLKNQLPLGKAALQITDVKLQDAGIYCCLISYGGADYKRITLKVNASYRKINGSVAAVPGSSGHELTCQSEGYPEAEVIWTRGNASGKGGPALSGKTTVTSSKREEKLFNVTSVLRINTTANEIFYCIFRRLGHEENSTAELVIPGPDWAPGRWTYPRSRLGVPGAFLAVLVIVVILIFYVK
ncbi:membrane protein De2 [Common bottlenose dolphin gammaherpesvirus 1 strain Sarasota]|uniref:Membrane protein De2 n=1 Tax=Common bottlenose dolphin gammaherpesvirus 1 strain Sarasota TaxID=2022783 RepID=A0A1Z1NE93_9GAMA|nr:membrane protein De2 [Common bottlenose dolphin gammaherpesvirus 1 strain Sarasota]ARW78068.1 membrane protein De2 [Common bottlenose dolphin gammaherpesvirus 1 strain Sarasota]